MQMIRKCIISHTRPDVAFAVSLVSQFMHQPKEIYFQVALWIVQYLKGTPGRGILFEQNGSVGLEAYTFFKHIRMLTIQGQLWMTMQGILDRISTTRYCTFLDGNLVTCKSEKTKCSIQSSVEVHYKIFSHILTGVIPTFSLFSTLGWAYFPDDTSVFSI